MTVTVKPTKDKANPPIKGPAVISWMNSWMIEWIHEQSNDFTESQDYLSQRRSLQKTGYAQQSLHMMRLLNIMNVVMLTITEVTVTPKWLKLEYRIVLTLPGTQFVEKQK